MTSRTAAHRVAVRAGEDAHDITGADLPGDGGLFASNVQPALSLTEMGGGVAMNFLNAGIPVTLVEEHGPDFRPAPLLERLAAEGRTFADYDRG